MKGRILAIDYGEVRVGLAISDPLRILSTPFDVYKNDDLLLKKLKSLVKEKEIKLILLGLPLNLKGEDSKKTKEVREFYQIIKDNFDVPIEFVDERFTTYEANNELKRLGYGVKESRKVIDKIAASLILKTYLRKSE